MQIDPKKKKYIKTNNQNSSYVKYGAFFIFFVGAFFVGQILYENGAHTSLKYILHGRYDELSEGAIKDSLEELHDLIKAETSAYSGNSLSTIYLDIPFENLQVLQLKRDEALQTGILLASDDDYVSATIRYNDSTPIDIELRLKGDWTDHLEGDKWSYRIHIKDDAAIEGMRRFSIQAPETRNFVYEWAYHENLMQEGLLAPRYFFVNVVENGENKGVFAMEESFYTDLIESQQRRSGIIVRFNEDDMWENISIFFAEGKEDLWTQAKNSGYFMVSDQDAANISAFSQGTVLENRVLKQEYQEAKNMLRAYQNGEALASEVFDLEQLGNYIAITELWGAGHGLAWHNLRFYYNPVTNLLEPIGFDGLPMTEPFTQVDFQSISDEDFFFNDSEIREAFYYSMWPYLQDDYLEKLKSEYFDQAKVFSDAMNKSYFVDTAINWERLYLQRDYLYEKLQPENFVSISSSNKTEDQYTFNFTNNFFVSLLVESIEIRNSSDDVLFDIDINKEVLPVKPNGTKDIGEQIIIELPIELPSDVGIFLKYSDPVSGGQYSIELESLH